MMFEEVDVVVEVDVRREGERVYLGVESRDGVGERVWKDWNKGVEEI